MLKQPIEVFSSPLTILNTLNLLKNEGSKIGFIPTMGALHSGHIALVQKAIANGEIPVVSIFVNPKQFNNAEDLKKYPRTLETDCNLLEEAGVKYVFAPTIDDIYPADYKSLKLDLGRLDKILEGEFRPGHFDGVVAVVNRLFEIIAPHSAYFGRKDFQQVAVIKFMVKATKSEVKVVVCETLREASGLAMSSRNMRLSEKEKQDALVIYETLKAGKQHALNFRPKTVAEVMLSLFHAFSLRDEVNMRSEYIKVVDPVTLEELYEDWVPGATCCIACYCGEVRLIDNMELVPLS